MDVVRLSSPAEPLTEDPFAGGNVTPAPDFDGARFTASGASDDELRQLAEHYDAAPRANRLQITGWLETASADDVTEWLETWRGFTAEAEARAALIDGTVDEVLDRVRAASDEERLDLAERTLAAEEVEGEDDARTTLVEGLERIIAEEQERTPPAPDGSPESDGDGSGGPGTPETPETPEDGQAGTATEAPEPTP